ncbi:unnamed protein product [Adineta ricciae]|uniref:Aspergillus nuclease S(1) n=1 Tax=Adineta ricciae TaxID=249248 RepID=A0A814T7I5_ADIRI|nr:unnamed protein product [Adineta ricciae]
MFERSCWILFFFGKILFCVHGWGPVGHATIVRLAQSQLTKEGLERIAPLIPWHWNGNLSAMASWADDILYSDANPTGYGNWQWSRPLHYINVPDWNCEYRPERDCINDICVAGAIRNYTKRLETEWDDIQQREALYFLIHFTGDIHQPLHTGFVSDRGGNSIKGHYMGGSYLTNLHSLWDSGMITTRLRRDFQSNSTLYYEYIHKLMLEQTPHEDDNTIDAWVKDNVNIVCTQIYLDENNHTMNVSTNFTLGEAYYSRSISIIERRLAQGGRRLGIILNRLANKRPIKPVDEDKKLCTSTIVLIAVLAAVCIVGIVGGVILWIRHKKRATQPISFNLARKI